MLVDMCGPSKVFVDKCARIKYLCIQVNCWMSFWYLNRYYTWVLVHLIMEKKAFSYPSWNFPKPMGLSMEHVCSKLIGPRWYKKSGAVQMTIFKSFKFIQKNHWHVYPPSCRNVRSGSSPLPQRKHERWDDLVVLVGSDLPHAEPEWKRKHVVDFLWDYRCIHLSINVCIPPYLLIVVLAIVIEDITCAVKGLVQEQKTHCRSISAGVTFLGWLLTSNFWNKTHTNHKLIINPCN